MLNVRVRFKLHGSLSNYYRLDVRTDEFGILRYSLSGWSGSTSYALSNMMRTRHGGRDLPATIHDYATMLEFMGDLIARVDSNNYEIDTIVYQLHKIVDTDCGVSDAEKMMREFNKAEFEADMGAENVPGN